MAACSSSSDRSRAAIRSWALIPKPNRKRACRRGDPTLQIVLQLDIPLTVPPETLMAFKTCGDADLIREMGMNTTLADEKYGPGWLDREE